MKLTIFYSNGKQYNLKGKSIDISDQGSSVVLSVINKTKHISKVVTKQVFESIEIKKSDLLGVCLVEDGNITTTFAYSKNFKTFCYQEVLV